MRYTSAILISFFLVNIVYSQQPPHCINKNPLDWSRWEIQVPEEEKSKIIEKLKRTVEIEFGLDYYLYTYKNIMDSYHFIDFNNDGYYDVIYNGFAGTNNSGVIFYEYQNGSFVKTLSLFGDIIELWRYDIWSPLSFKLWNYRCCGGYVNFIETYNPEVYQAARGKTRYNLSDRIAYVHGTEIPKKFSLYTPLKVVKNNTFLKALPNTDDSLYYYHLTTQPVEDANPYYRFFTFSGNIVAIFDTNATGFILADRMDKSGQKWYFVMMSKEKISSTVFCQEGHNNSGNYFMLGWIKNERLKIVDHYNE